MTKSQIVFGRWVRLDLLLADADVRREAGYQEQWERHVAATTTTTTTTTTQENDGAVDAEEFVRVYCFDMDEERLGCAVQRLTSGVLTVVRSQQSLTSLPCEDDWILCFATVDLNSKPDAETLRDTFSRLLVHDVPVFVDFASRFRSAHTSTACRRGDDWTPRLLSLSRPCYGRCR